MNSIMQSKQKRKTLQELTFKDDFMFSAVMMIGDNAKAVLERTLEIEIRHIRVIYEKSLVYNPECKGVRLDVEAEDEGHTHYDVEMQVANQEILKRARFYHDQLDMDLLLSGQEYEQLPDVFVIFICDFDPLGLEKYKYTMRQTLEEDNSYDYQDGCHTIFLSTKGKNDCEVPKELVKLLKFVSAGLDDSQKDFEDDLVRRLQESVEKVKKDREMGRRYMRLEELMKQEFKAGRAEGQQASIYALLSEIAPVSDNLQERILSVTDTELLNNLLKKSARVKSIEEFEACLDQMNL